MHAGKQSIVIIIIIIMRHRQLAVIGLRGERERQRHTYKLLERERAIAKEGQVPVAVAK